MKIVIINIRIGWLGWVMGRDIKKGVAAGAGLSIFSGDSTVCLCLFHMPLSLTPLKLSVHSLGYQTLYKVYKFTRNIFVTSRIPFFSSRLIIL